ncbi:unnamed protein product [Oppiella nova]|uniref:Uncharacterized protein n=1 Tax=Oppiella nova TaxID=334625 RepID=A0A7R9LZC4_9ACAR|nr:unnamed protein product [Oppiella nova]CAG2168353.1 unnamed protein product [Oppiella nova]
MVNYESYLRPECNDILNKFDKWSLSKDIIDSNISAFNKFINQHNSEDLVFKNIIITHKLKMDKINNESPVSPHHENIKPGANTGAIPKRVSSSISRNTESNVSTGSIRSIREKFEKLSQNSKTGK